MTTALVPGRPDLVAEAERLSVERMADRAATYDEEGSFPFEDYEDLHRAGLIGILVPQEYGGLGADTLTYAMVVKALAKGNASTALTFNMHNTVITLINALGTDDQKRRYFRAVVEDGALCATITSEPTSSLRGRFTLETKATATPEGFVVNGTKHFCSLSEAATFYLVWASQEGLPVHEGLLNLVVRQDNPGVRLDRTWNSVAMRSTSSHSLHFENCHVPAEDLLGEPAAVLKNDLADSFILGYAGVYLGIAEGALDYTVQYTNKTVFRPDNVPISHFPQVQTHVADMAVRVEAGKLMLARAAEARQSGSREERAKWLNQAKYFNTETATYVTDMALRVCGGRGLLKRHPLERYFRDARAGIIMPPHNDKALEIIGKAHLGLEVSGGFISNA